MKKVKQLTKKQKIEQKKQAVKAHNNGIDEYINMAHKHYKAHIANPYKEDDGYTLKFSGFTASGSFCTYQSKNFIDLINLLNSLKK